MSPNVSTESPLLRAVKLLIAVLSPDDRKTLRPWLLARFDVGGQAQHRYGEEQA